MDRLRLCVDRPRLYEGQFACTLRGPKEKAKKNKKRRRVTDIVIVEYGADREELMVDLGFSLFCTCRSPSVFTGLISVDWDRG